MKAAGGFRSLLLSCLRRDWTGALYLNVDGLGWPSEGQYNDGDGGDYGPHDDQAVVLLGDFAWFSDCWSVVPSVCIPIVSRPPFKLFCNSVTLVM